MQKQVRAEILISDYDAQHGCKQAIWDPAWKHNQMHDDSLQKNIFTMKCQVLIVFTEQIQLWSTVGS